MVVKDLLKNNNWVFEETCDSVAYTSNILNP